MSCLVWQTSTQVYIVHSANEKVVWRLARLQDAPVRVQDATSRIPQFCLWIMTCCNQIYWSVFIFPRQKLESIRGCATSIWLVEFSSIITVLWCRWAVPFLTFYSRKCSGKVREVACKPSWQPHRWALPGVNWLLR